MAQKVMYPGMVNSPETTITNGINESDTIIYVLDPARVPTPPNLMTLGTGTNAETVKVTEINDSAITVERGFQGIAKSWPAGTVIARNFTEYDYDTLKENIEDLDTSKETPAGAQAKADEAEAAAKTYADQEVADLAGEGRTTETVKGNADALNSHLSDYANYVLQPVFNVMGFGAKGDGVTDDYSAIQAAINAAVNAGGGIVFFPPGGTYLVNIGLVIDGDNIYLFGKGATLLFDGSNSIAVDFCKSGSYIFNGGIDGLNIQKVSEEWATDTSIGLRLYNVQEGFLTDFSVQDFTTGLKLEGNGQGCVHNQINIRRLFNNKTNLHLVASNNGWCNENIFIGGRFSYSSDRVGGYTGTTNIKIDYYAEKPINNNKFFGCSLESASSDTKAIYCEGAFNFFYGCRYETSVEIVFTANSSDNVLLYGNTIRRANIINDGRYNHLFCREGIDIFGSTLTSQGVARFNNNASATYPSVEFLSPVKEVVGSVDGIGNFIGRSMKVNSNANDGYKFSNNRVIVAVVGSPEGVVTAPPGSLALNGNGGASETLWVKETGTGSTGWVAK